MKHLPLLLAALVLTAFAATVSNLAEAYAARTQPQVGKPGKPDATVIAWLPATVVPCKHRK